MVKNTPSYFNIRNIGLLLAVAAIYYVSARAGLLLAYKNTNATSVWPPSGIALAALILFGYSMWPGIMLGAFLVNVVVFLSNHIDPSTAFWASLFISIGNTLSALVGYFLLKRTPEDISRLEKVKHVLAFILIVLLMCLVSSTIGSLVICFAKIISWNQHHVVWFTWWLGDVTGVLIVMPLLLSCVNYFKVKRKWNWNWKIVGTIVLYGLVFFFSELIFSDWLPVDSPFVRPYLIFPLLLWAAFYFGQQTLTTAIALSSTIAILGTVEGHGPFALASINDSLLSLQMYLSTITLTILALKATVNARERSEKTLHDAHQELIFIAIERKKELDDYHKRIDNIFQAIFKYTLMDFSQKTIVSEKGDEIDAIAAGLNTLSEELGFYIRKLQESEEKLINSENFLNLIVENIPNMLFVKDAKDLKFVRFNKAGEELLGYSRNDLIGKNDYDFFSKEEAEFFTSKDRVVLENKKLLDIPEESVKTNNKGTRILETKKIPILDNEGKPLYLLGISNDITERRKMQEALQISEEKFNTAFRLSPAGIAIINLSTGKYMDVNDSFLRIIGFEREEIVGHTSLETNIFDPDVNKQILEEIKTEGSIRNKEIAFRKKSGETGTLLFSTELININNASHTLTILYDITKRIKAETELKQKSEELARSNQELEQFAYVASHDLQEPLRMVNSYVQLLSNRYKDKLDEDANDFIAFAVDGSNRMRMLIQSLLEYSRVNRVKPFEKININEVLTEVQHDIKGVIEENKAIIKIDQLPDIIGDTVLIGQLFQNLIINAIKFRGKESPAVSISGEKINGNEYLFSVKDNGIGIQKEYREKIFIIFQRLHNKDKYSGTGIGLAICKKIVERHGGEIWVESETGEGSTFYFTIKDGIIEV